MLGLLAFKSVKKTRNEPDETNPYKKSFGDRRSSKGVEIEWKGKGEEIKKGPYSIKNPFTYISNGKPDYDDVSCINLKLKVGKPNRQLNENLGYYPSYDQISPDQRAKYLNWLSGDRKDVLDDIGYVFIFFYGLERRFLVENKDPNLIVNEIIKLRKRYKISNSFLGYSGRFLVYILIRVGLEKVNPKTFKSILENTELLNFEEGYMVCLAWLGIHQLSISSSLAFSLISYDPRVSKSVIPEQAPKQFRKLFQEKISKRFKDSVKLKVSKTTVKIGYHPSSSSLSFNFNGFNEVAIPNMLAIKQPFTTWLEIWNESIEELRPFCRKIKNIGTVDSREAFEALPDALRKENLHPDSKKWEKVFSMNTDSNGFAVIQVEKLASIHGIGKRDRLTKKQSLSLALTSEMVGFAIEPDVRIKNKPFLWEEPIALFRGKENEKLEVSSRYKSASLLLELGVAVAAADGQIDNEELGFIKHFLEGQFMLDKSEIFRLEGLKQVLIKEPPSLQGLGKKIKESLPENQTEKICQFLIGVAAADGKIDDDEIKLLKKVYKAFGLDTKKLIDFVEEARSKLDEPVIVKPSNSRKEQGEEIPERKEPGGISLNAERIKEILVDTREVSKLLAEVLYVDEDFEDEEMEMVKEETNSFEARFEGLKVQLHEVLTELLRQESWGKNEFEMLVRKFDLMPSGTILDINEWSEERFDDVLIEEGESITINTQISVQI